MDIRTSDTITTIVLASIAQLCATLMFTLVGVSETSRSISLPGSRVKGGGEMRLHRIIVHSAEISAFA